MLSASLPLTVPLVVDTHDGLILNGKLTLPASPGPWPVVVFVGGSGVWDSDYASTGPDGVLRPLFPVATLAERLAAAGYAVMRYQKRGVTDPGGRPTPAWRTATLANLIADAKTMIALAKADARLGAIAVVAHSEGTMVATWAAGQDADVRTLAFMGMGYRNALEIVRAQRRDVPIPVLLERLEAAGPDDLVLGFPAQWWREHHSSASMAEAWRTIRTPVLVQHGDLDTMAPVDTEAIPFVAQLQAEGHPDYAFHRYPTLDHFFKDEADTFQLESVTTDLVAWLTTHLT